MPRIVITNVSSGALSLDIPVPFGAGMGHPKAICARLAGGESIDVGDVTTVDDLNRTVEFQRLLSTGLISVVVEPEPSDVQDPGGGGPGFVPNRRDHSVNGASVDLFDLGMLATLRTKTDQHGPGAYTGPGAGNKAILGHFLPAPMPLADLVEIVFTVERLTPEATALSGNTLPYGNLVVELVPASAIYSLLVFGAVGNPLLLGVYSTPTPTQHRCVWTAALPTSGVLVVRDKGMATFPIPPGPIIVPVSQGPAQTVPGAWQTHAYSVAGILGAYPAAQIVNAYSADNGMPQLPTVTSGVMMIIGDSLNVAANAVRVVEWTLNGEPI